MITRNSEICHFTKICGDAKPCVAAMVKLFEANPLAFGLPAPTIEKLLKTGQGETVSLTPFENPLVQQIQRGKPFLARR